MEEYFNGLLKEVDQRMATTAPGMDGKEVIGVCREMVSYLKGKNRELKEYALAHPFAGDAKEILYFKYYKPALTGRLLYYYRVYQIESGCPACLRVAEPYYRKAMERAERMMERYLPFYQYYHSGATYRDSYYFLRAKGELSPESGSFVLDEEAEFSTGYDILAARLISVEMLLVHLSRRMERAAQGTETEAVPEKEHRWTNTKVAAILLVYGIHVTGSVDEGNAEIGELAALFEKHFHVDLGNVYHAFGRLRGQQNPTAFLDEMKERLLKRCGTWIAGSKLATGRQDTGRERPKGWKEPSGRSFLPRLGPFYRPERQEGRKCAPKKIFAKVLI